jgi:nucleoside-diphosphate-sugar epimerase
MKILLTGASSWVGAEIARQLHESGCQLVGLDLPAAAPIQEDDFSEFHYADVADPAAWGPWVAGSAAVVHLAIARAPDELFRTNVEGTYRLFDAVHRYGVGRVVLVGSAPVHIQAARRGQLAAHGDCLAGPGGDFGYDLTKCLQEQIARQFCATYGMTALVLRAGHIVDGRAGRDPHGRLLADLAYCRGGWVDRGDLARAVVAAALSWRGQGYEAFHLIGSRTARNHFNIERTEQELGVVCEYGFENYS